ncbi:MAG: amphi-Trp domain-containing protein [Desulfobulbaceae bacterium]|nr:amphi-Trp domain-containing protein [Desulfobulbaceae bacterium]
MSNLKFNYESLQDTETIKTYLESLIDSIQKGCINLKSNGEEISMQVDDLVKFTVRAKKKDGLNKLNIKLSWAESKDKKLDTSKPMIIS